MKNTVKGVAIVLGFLLAGALHTNAQEFKTDESISSQLKNGTAPGLKFGPAARNSARTAATTKDPNEGAETPVAQIRKGTLKGVRFAGGGSTGRSVQRSARSAARVQGAGNLPSDQKAIELKPFSPVKPGVVPTQERAVDAPDSKATLPPARNGLQLKKQQ